MEWVEKVEWMTRKVEGDEELKKKQKTKKKPAGARAGALDYFLQKNVQIVAEMWVTVPKGPKAVFTESILKRRTKKKKQKCNFVCM